MNDSFGTGNPSEAVSVDKLSYEQARDELIETVKILELGQMGLDESLKYWERGEALAKRCEEHLDRASKRVDDAMNARSARSDNSANSANDDGSGAESNTASDSGSAH
ncbi:exodeoxyribonuclease VII small subunit [Corynebacterium sp. MNWGS58]|uniref:exodeoxyribonuclease VII small subunit n=1 Tax=Corynebacterium sp. 102791.4 TaxID=3104612 RepID=UPI0035178538